MYKCSEDKHLQLSISNNCKLFFSSVIVVTILILYTVQFLQVDDGEPDPPGVEEPLTESI